MFQLSQIAGADANKLFFKYHLKNNLGQITSGSHGIGGFFACIVHKTHKRIFFRFHSALGRFFTAYLPVVAYIVIHQTRPVAATASPHHVLKSNAQPMRRIAPPDNSIPQKRVSDVPSSLTTSAPEYRMGLASGLQTQTISHIHQRKNPPIAFRIHESFE
ncbi:hypothetical protein [Oscillibacter sp.]|uniref:hypothetical protein n=1 Tax=Oscillibacter sp. TaxID=1945593 RepID=UPI002899DC4F|nr:hypothetical protein [Oscillibacter sp.]